MIEGACHCGALTVRFDTALTPAQLPVRTCGCGFCLRHRPRYTSDPAGHVTLTAAGEPALSRYRFGLRLADFLICRACGVFVAAFEPGDPGRAVINLEVLATAADFVGPPTQFAAYDSEDAATRTARRARGWTPATLVVGRREV